MALGDLEKKKDCNIVQGTEVPRQSSSHRGRCEIYRIIPHSHEATAPLSTCCSEQRNALNRMDVGCEHTFNSHMCNNAFYCCTDKHDKSEELSPRAYIGLHIPHIALTQPLQDGLKTRRSLPVFECVNECLFVSPRRGETSRALHKTLHTTAGSGGRVLE